MSLSVKTIDETDADAFLGLQYDTDLETSFLMRDPLRDSVSNEEMRQRIRLISESQNRTILLCTDGTHLVGYISARGGALVRNQGVVNIALAVRRQWWRQGIGTLLVKHLESWAKENDIYRLELLVSVENTASVALFKHLGYEQEGVKHRGAKINGVFIDKFYMAKLL
jgi:RimJ/RimL family protein N-acetyltransferase